MRKGKKTIDIVHELVAKGHNITYYVRKDGGILITSIDGVKYKGAKGNEVARQMVGYSLSEAKKKQLTYATRQRRRKKIKLPNALEEEYKRVKEIWNKAFKAKEGKPHPAGYFGEGRIEKTYKEEGTEKALARIKEAEKYASGIAYEENVNHLAFYISEWATAFDSPELEKLAEDLLTHKDIIKEASILPAYEILYKLNAGESPKKIAKKLRKILLL